MLTKVRHKLANNYPTLCTTSQYKNKPKLHNGPVVIQIDAVLYSVYLLYIKILTAAYPSLSCRISYVLNCLLLIYNFNYKIS